ncbi:MAG: hypothetical protein JJT89_13475 [Nitriliruptoraceae bacterium]|nr:hypothetical protein [Nitriliruptoraceae bacterium]
MTNELTPRDGHGSVEPAGARQAPVGLEPQLRELGRIRCGHRVTTESGKVRPAKLERFRLTSPQRRLIDAASGVWGGKVEPWRNDAAGRDEWQIIIEADEIDVLVPPTRSFSAAWELWSGGGVERRCDGLIEELSGEACMCPLGRERMEAAADGKACKPTTRVNVILGDLPDLGVWRLEVHSWYGARELAGAQALIDLAASRGQMIAARLRLDARRIRRKGEPVKDFRVPVLEIPQTLGQLLEATGQTAAIAGPIPAAALAGPASAPPAQELPPAPDAPPDEPGPGQDDGPAPAGRARLAALLAGAEVSRPAIDALLRARYGASKLEDLEDDVADQLADRLADVNTLNRFRAAASADLRAELENDDEPVPF